MHYLLMGKFDGQMPRAIYIITKICVDYYKHIHAWVSAVVSIITNTYAHEWARRARVCGLLGLMHSATAICIDHRILWCYIKLQQHSKSLFVWCCSLQSTFLLRYLQRLHHVGYTRNPMPRFVKYMYTYILCTIYCWMKFDAEMSRGFPLAHDSSI